MWGNRRRLLFTFVFSIVALLLGLWWGPAAPARAQATGMIDVRVASAEDDAEENVFGWVRPSTDLDMIFDRLGNSLLEAVGIRFTGVAIPVGARITRAYVEFQVDETSDVPSSLLIQGEATDDAAAFTICQFNPGCYDITNRLTTSAGVSWQPPPWLLVGARERTDDISAIIQEIVNRPGWASGNAIAIIITGDPLSERTAEAFEGDPNGAPLLHVEWDNPGHVTLRKLTNGVENQTMVWDFSLAGPGVDETDASPPTTVDFGGASLRPGDEYALCETGIPAGWTSEWQVDTDGDGTADIIIPMVAAVNDDPVDPALGFSRVYDPNFVPLPDTYTNDTRCVNVVVDPDETLAFQIDNRYPGGEPRSAGFWKNWNTCTGGNQAQTAANNGGPAAGWFILNDLLNVPDYTLGNLQLDGTSCHDAVNLLDKRNLDGRKKANDAAYGLAAQVLAAQLNLSAGAETCQAAVDAVNAGQGLLQSIGFDGTGSYLRPKDGLFHDANNLAAILDGYNNGDLCQ